MGMTSDAKVGRGCAVSSAMRCRFSASTCSSAGRAWCASMRPKAGSDSNSSSGLFTAKILSDVRQHPGEGGAAAHETADAGHCAAPELPRKCFAVRCGQQKCASIRGIAEDVDRGRTHLGRTPIQDLPARGSARLLPLRRAQCAVVVGVEAGKQGGLVFFPLVQQVRGGGLVILGAGAAETAKCTDGVDMFVRLQAIFGVAVFAGQQSVGQPAENSRAVGYAYLRPFRRSVPDIARAGKDFGAARIDQTLTGAVVQKEGFGAGIALDREPRARSARVAPLLDLIAPPGTGNLGQRRLIVAIRRQYAESADFDIALRSGAHSGRRRDLDGAD